MGPSHLKRRETRSDTGTSLPFPEATLSCLFFWKQNNPLNENGSTDFISMVDWKAETSVTRGHLLASREAAHSAPSRRAWSQAGCGLRGSGYPKKRKDELGEQGHFPVNTQRFCGDVGGNSSRRKQPRALNSVPPGAGENAGFSRKGYFLPGDKRFLFSREESTAPASARR